MAIRSDGLSWLLLRGLAREHRHWESFPDCLRDHLRGARVLVADLPGCGTRNAERCPRHLSQMLESVRGEVLSQQPALPMFLVGLSLGGMLALEWASRHPTECAGIVVMNTSLAGVSPFYDRLRLFNCRRLAAQILLRRGIRARESAVLNLTSNRRPCPDSLVEKWTCFAQERPVSSINLLRQLSAAMRYRGPGTRPAVPGLVLAGQGDRLVNPTCSVRIARRWALPLALHASAGHDLTLDAAEWVCDEICCWLARC